MIYQTTTSGRRVKQLLSQKASRVSFQINAKALPPWETLSYLGMKTAYNNSNWLAMFQNLNKAQRQWGVILEVLKNPGAMVRAHGMMYKAVEQLVLLYGSDS